MNGFALCLLVILAADAVRSQGPPTQTKKGIRPGRPNDNTDRGLPSGADVPDGTRFAPAPTQTRAGAVPPTAGRPAPPAAAGPASPAGAAPVLSGPPPPARRPAPPAAPAGRPNDNTDRGLPSGADVPDGTRFAPAPTQTRAGPPPAGPPAAGSPPPAGAVPPTAGRPAPPAAAGSASPAGAAPVLSGPPPPARRPAPPAAPAGRPNDNTDRGLPSGADVPDGTRTRSGPPPPSFRAASALPAAPAGPVAPSRSAAFFNYLAPAAPAVPAMPCEAFCDMTSYKPVCSINGNQYDNDCLRECAGEPRQCENPCPCNASPVVYADTPIVSECPFCPQDWDPVCIDNEETVQNECIAKCQGKTITCSSSCPC
ncbi:basic proline-rich protein-like [Dreissena polymorpha]|uniref:basic proline-rich protein-like n=1 Tax=Dreissena polymorpha TaxID=45954 RepID=UPI002263D5AC|nr:basic proline-rich protein-like [Dreissena polymorpha]